MRGRLLELSARRRQTMQKRRHERIIAEVESKDIDMVLRPRLVEALANPAKDVSEQRSQGGVHGHSPAERTRIGEVSGTIARPVLDSRNDTGTGCAGQPTARDRASAK